MIIVLTGVSRGLGRAMTEEFVERGHVIWGCSRSRREIEQLRNRFPAPNDFQVVDVASDAEVQVWARSLLDTSGVPELLLNNAGVINRNASLWEVSAEEFSTVIDVNVKGAANTIRHFAPAMIRQKRGIIVNFSSGWGRSTDAEVAPYCASKWAIEGLTQALAQELPPGLAAVALNPGTINTQMLQSCFGPSAASSPSPERWAKVAVPFILRIKLGDNGKPLTVPAA
jgi:NAD(P)-dependent dehydrogenase (short-subunit alcohol dehydrogenase family)